MTVAKAEKPSAEDHLIIRCTVCGHQATHECSYAGQFVCGYPLCDKCEGYHDGTPSAWVIGHHHRRKEPTDAK